MPGLTRGGQQFYRGRTAEDERDPGQIFLTNIPEMATFYGGPEVEPLPAPRGLLPIEERQAPQAPRTPQQERDNILSWGRENSKSPAEVTEVLRLHGVETISPAEPAKEAKTIETAEGIFQWNPESKRYDIRVGAGKGTGKDARGGKAAGAIANMIRAGQTVVRDSDEALARMEKSNLFKTGGIIGANARAAASVIKGSDTWEINRLIESTKANIGIDTLLNIKREGSGLGQVPQQQLITLQSVLGQLEVARDPKLLKRDLKHVKKLYTDIVEKAGGEILPTDIINDEVAPPQVDDFEARYEAMPSGTEFTDPDGEKRRKP